ncbi:hypothetical protein LTS10_006093 [Elasticomyces elasticus]|nr:hypothetical protein LTS10_006093 [Elasticomyces elasticus]
MPGGITKPVRKTPYSADMSSRNIQSLLGAIADMDRHNPPKLHERATAPVDNTNDDTMPADPSIVDNTIDNQSDDDLIYVDTQVVPSLMFATPTDDTTMRGGTFGKPDPEVEYCYLIADIDVDANTIADAHLYGPINEEHIRGQYPEQAKAVDRRIVEQARTELQALIGNRVRITFETCQATMKAIDEEFNRSLDEDWAQRDSALTVIESKAKKPSIDLLASRRSQGVLERCTARRYAAKSRQIHRMEVYGERLASASQALMVYLEELARSAGDDKLASLGETLGARLAELEACVKPSEATEDDEGVEFLYIKTAAPSSEL